MTAQKAPVAEVELAILRLLLGRLETVGRDNRSTASGGRFELAGNLADIAEYRWANEEHRVVFESIRRMQRRTSASSLRGDLAAEATRLGHPDVDWATYFASPEPGADLLDLLEKLKSAQAGK
jgi:hypothetical protein